MRPMTFAPALGWIAGGAIAALMLAFAVAVVVVHVRRRRSSDETLTACIRRVIMFLLAAVMMLTPSIVTTTTSRAINATDVMVAVDVTGSMAVKDAEYGSSGTISRLDAAKRIAKGITSTYADSSFAALRFGASSTLDVPLTPDSIAIDGWADTLAVESTSTSAGSSLDTPLDQLMLSLKSIRDQHPDDIIVLYVITDGEQTSDTARRSYSALRRYLDDSFTIGVGSDAGGKIPMASDGTATGQQSDGQWVTDPTTGKPGISKLDEATLESIADEMGGSYLHVDASHTIEQAVSAKASRQWRLTQTVKRRAYDSRDMAVRRGAGPAARLGDRAWIAMSRGCYEIPEINESCDEKQHSEEARGERRAANGREAKDRAVARTPLWSRILIGIVAMACLCAGIAAGANLIAVTAFDDATSQLNGNLKAASKDDADLSTLSALQQKADARFADAAAWSALLLPQVKDVIDTNASVSATLTERINAQLQKQQNTETSNAQTTPGSDGNAKQSGGLTQEQRKQVDDLLKSNQQSNSQNGSKGGKGKSSSNTNSTTKPW